MKTFNLKSKLVEVLVSNSLRVAFVLIAFTLGVINAIADDSPYRIGVIIPLTGSLAHYGNTVRGAIERVKTSNVQWVFEDEACDPTKTISAFKRLTYLKNIHLIIGPTCGSPQKVLAPLVKGKKDLIVLPNAAPLSVLESSGGNMYSVQYSVDSEARFLADQMNQRGLKKVAIISVDSDFSRTMEVSFTKAFNGNVAYLFHAPGDSSQYMKDAALKLKTIDFDSIFLADISPLFYGFLTELKNWKFHRDQRLQIMVRRSLML